MTRAVAAKVEGVGIVENVMRSIAADGFPVNVATTPGTLAEYLRRQVRLELMSASFTHLLSDRILVDGAAYVLAAQRMRLLRYPWGPGEIEFLVAAARLHATFFDVHLLVPIEFNFSGPDPLHAHGAEFRQAVDTTLRELLAEDWPIPLVEVTGSVEGRAATAIELLTRN